MHPHALPIYRALFGFRVFIKNCFRFKQLWSVNFQVFCLIVEVHPYRICLCHFKLFIDFPGHVSMAVSEAPGTSKWWKKSVQSPAIVNKQAEEKLRGRDKDTIVYVNCQPTRFSILKWHYLAAFMLSMAFPASLFAFLLRLVGSTMKAENAKNK